MGRFLWPVGEHPPLRQDDPIVEPRWAVSTDAATCGPLLLGIVAGFKIAIALWQSYWQRIPTADELARLTKVGQSVFRPDYDIPIYLVGIPIAVLLSLFMGWGWRRRLTRRQAGPERHFSRFLALSHYPLAAGLIAAPVLNSDNPKLNVFTVAAALAYSLVAWLTSYRVFLGCVHRFRRASPLVLGAITAIAPLAVIVLLYVPDRAELASRNFALDRFHHWDYYAMTPAAGYRHGQALCSTCYTQYGVGWPMTFALLSTWTPLAYKTLLTVAMLWICTYFTLLFFLLRSLTGHALWAACGVLLTIYLQVFSGTDAPILLYPSSSILRNPFDLLVFGVCLIYLRRPRGAWGALVGALMGLEMLFSLELGVYLVVALMFLIGCLWRMPVDSQVSRLRRTFVVAWAASFLTVLLLGLAIAGRGTLFQAEFWNGWIEPLRIYTGGISSRPIRTAADVRRHHLVLLAMLSIYGFALVRATELALRRQLKVNDVMQGTIALYGFEMLLLFINRSDSHNLYHPTVPLGIVSTVFAAQLHAWLVRVVPAGWPLGSRAAIRAAVKLLPLAALGVCLGALWINPNVKDYPNLLAQWTKTRPWRLPSGDDQFLFASRRDVPLSYAKNAQQLDEFQAGMNIIARLRDQGRSVALIGDSDTRFLVEADLAPFFRYSPVFRSLRWSEVESDKQALATHPPDYVLLFPSPRYQDVQDAFDDLLAEKFILEEEAAGVRVYRSKTIAAAASSALKN